jgi:hypothetical protein
MAPAELAFEKLALALETVHGTAIANPTHYLNMVGRIVPSTSRSRRSRSDGTLAEYPASVITRKGSTFETDDSDLDVNTLPVLANMAIKAVTSPSTPGGGTLSRLWTFAPTMTSDDLKSATIWWGDPGNQILRSTYNMIDELTISADASSEDGAMMSVTGYGKFPTSVAAPTYPSQIAPGLIIGQNMELWVDTSSAIGTTAITGRVVSTEWTIPAGTTQKYLAGGTTADLSFSRHGRLKRHAEANIVFELADMAQYDLFAAGTVAKTRIRLNGMTAIETTLFPYVELDIYGPYDFDSWGDLEGSNRTIALTILSEYDATAGYDFALKVQNARATL